MQFGAWGTSSSVTLRGCRPGVSRSRFRPDHDDKLGGSDFSGDSTDSSDISNLIVTFIIHTFIASFYFFLSYFTLC